MPDLTESPTWSTGVFQLELTTPATGGPGGVMNSQAQALANRSQWLRQQVEARLPLSGGTLTGALTITVSAGLTAPGVTLASAGPRLWMNAASVDGTSIIVGQRNGVDRWRMVVASNAPETGGDTGSDFVLQSQTDAGNAKATPFRVLRATGQVLLSSGLEAAADVQAGYWFRSGGAGNRMAMNTAHALEFHWNNGFYYRIDGNSWVLINASPSDESLKQDVEDIEGALDTVRRLRPITYRFKAGLTIATPPGERAGFVLQEARAVLPSLGRESGLPGTEDTVLCYGDDDDKQLIALLVGAVKELAARVEALERDGRTPP